MLLHSRKLRDEGRFAGRPSVDENVRCYVISAVDLFDGITRQQKRFNDPNLVRNTIILDIEYLNDILSYALEACPNIHGV